MFNLKFWGCCIPKVWGGSEEERGGGVVSLVGLEPLLIGNSRSKARLPPPWWGKAAINICR